ncbi:MAG: glycosyltransferase family 4 protein [Xenococcaceae cyanobacterium MO_207.B15]|nr:glycosyltransferase family 4 protein [Xenococcaceae cyanobacterium MO_207.B15]
MVKNSISEDSVIKPYFWKKSSYAPITENSTPQKFSVSIITQFYPPDYAATGQLIQELATQLRQDDIKVNIFTGQPGYAFKQKKAPKVERVNGVKVRRSRTSQLFSKRILGKTLNGVLFSLRAGLHILSRRNKNDVLLLTTAPPFLCIIGYIANFFFGIPYVCLIYDLYPDVATEFGLISPQHPITKLWNWINLRVWSRAKSIIVLSETMKDRIVARHSQVSFKISVIHNWANADWIKPITKKQNWFARQHGIDRKFTVLYSGNLGRCHDLETMLGAIEILKEEPIKFVFIGAGAKHKLCQQKAKELGLNNCQFLPYQDRRNLPYSLTACDLALVSIAPKMEGVVVPSKLYGVMAAGRAIAAICEPHSYLRQLLAKAQCGACFDNNDSQGLANFILSLASNPSRAVAMGKAGRKYLEANFTPKIIAKKYSQVLNPIHNSTPVVVSR